MGVVIKDTVFYEDKVGNKIQYYLVTSKLMELYMFIAIIGYLILLYLLLQVSYISCLLMFRKPLADSEKPSPSMSDVYLNSA